MKKGLPRQSLFHVWQTGMWEGAMPRAVRERQTQKSPPKRAFLSEEGLASSSQIMISQRS